jgi:hypothetical protein
MQWVYKATNKKVDSGATLILVDRRGFLCRSAYQDNRAWASNVRDVKAGHVIHVYYMRHGKTPGELGSFEVIEPTAHVRPELFGDRVEGTALYAVTDPQFIQHLVGLGGYAPDPVLGRFTGWPVRGVSRSPSYDPKMFTARATLQRYEPTPRKGTGGLGVG